MDKKEKLRLYHEMVLIRLLEERSATLYREGRIGGFLHLYIGQEAVGCGVISARRPEDRVITAYRDHGIAISCGMKPEVVMAELLGKDSGCSRGMGGSMHMADVDLNFWGGHAIVGAHLPLAAGMAWADKHRGSDAATICFFGEGATNIGYFHEALNLSKVWELPVLWVCENNEYAMGTAVDRASAVDEIRRKAEGYGMPSACVDGMQLLEVRQAAIEALSYVREQGPFFLEAITYRFMGHSMGGPERYRHSEEIQRWRENDPIGIFRKHLLEIKGIGEKTLEREETRAEEQVEAAVRFAEESPEPTLDTLMSLIYAGEES
jgi:pyruvate dehydrogenase E1 component alpha subunit